MSGGKRKVYCEKKRKSVLIAEAIGSSFDAAMDGKIRIYVSPDLIELIVPDNPLSKGPCRT